MKVRDAFRQQGETCVALGSPFMGRLLSLIADRLGDGTVARRVLEWQGNPAANADSVPLRLAGALHALKLDGKALVDVYPPNNPTDDALWSAIESALDHHEEHILYWLASPPQTNEIRRSAPLMAVMSLVASEVDQPIDLLELGCSGGLNLRLDQFRIVLGNSRMGPENSPVTMTPEWTGPSPTRAKPDIRSRQGVDLRPINPTTREGRLKLLAYIWPDQPDRIANTDAAIRVARDVPADLVAGDAAEWLEQNLTSPLNGRVKVVFHTVAWQYFPEDVKQRAERAMSAYTGPLFRISMEADRGNGARLSLTRYPSGAVQQLGRADFHGRWVDWRV